MRRIAVLVTHDYYPSRPDRAEGDFAKTQLDLLNAACAPSGLVMEPVFWEDAHTDWSAFTAVTPLIAWNYPRSEALFMSRLDEIAAAGVPLFNTQDVVRANRDKGYLADFAAAGAPVPPTLAVDLCDSAAIAHAFEAFGANEIIAKPRVGAGAWRQARLLRGGALPPADVLPPGPALIQPFLPAVQAEGELSILVFGGEISHALLKTPADGDYRTQGQYGAIERGVTPPSEAVAAAKAILALSTAGQGGQPHVYARVDLVRGADGGWLLMELELIEPWLYLAHDRQGGRHGARLFADALEAALRGIR